MRYNTDISPKTLQAEIRHFDRMRFHLNGTQDEQEVAEQAHDICHQRLRTLVPNVHHVRGKTAFEIDDLPHLLLTRKLSSNLRRTTGSRQADREVAIQRLRALMGEGIYLEIYKFDITSFYESVKVAALSERLSRDQRVPQRTINLIADLVCPRESGPS